MVSSLMHFFFEVHHFRVHSEMLQKQSCSYNTCWLCLFLISHSGNDDDYASVAVLAQYVETVYGGDLIDLSTLDSINESRSHFGMDPLPDDMDTSKARKLFVEKLCKITKIYAAPVEGATRIGCTRTLMTQVPLPFEGANKLSLDEPLPPDSPAFTTVVPVELFGPGQGDTQWKVSNTVMRSLKLISKRIRGAQDASSTDDVSSAYIGLVNYAKKTFHEVNNALDKKFSDNKDDHRLGTDANVLGQATKLKIKNRPDTDLPEESMTPMEHMYFNYIPQIVLWWMKHWGKHDLQAKVKMNMAKKRIRRFQKQ